MSGNDHMPKIDLSKLKQSDINFMKLIEEQNLLRVQKIKALRHRNLLTIAGIGAAVFGIYGYSMYAVRQESFLDDFDEPEKTIN